jgi:hypothetical protein
VCVCARVCVCVCVCVYCKRGLRAYLMYASVSKETQLIGKRNLPIFGIPEVCLSVKRDLTHSQKSPTIIGIPEPLHGLFICCITGPVCVVRGGNGGGGGG